MAFQWNSVLLEKMETLWAETRAVPCESRTTGSAGSHLPFLVFLTTCAGRTLRGSEVHEDKVAQKKKFWPADAKLENEFIPERSDEPAKQVLPTFKRPVGIWFFDV